MAQQATIPAADPATAAVSPTGVAATARWQRHVDDFLIPVALFGLAWFVYAWITNGRTVDLDYFVPLADALLHGRLGLIEAPSWLNELVPGDGGLYYLVYPPMPAVVLLPAVALFGPEFEQGWASILLGAFNVVVVYWVVQGMGVARFPRVVLTLVFAFGTIVWYSAQAGSSWHFAHVVCTLFLFLAIRACQLDLRLALIGLLFGAAVLSRLPVVLAASFFLAYLVDRSLRGVDREAAETAGVDDDADVGIDAADGGGVDRTPFGSLLVDRPRAWETRPEPRRVVELGLEFALGAAVLLLFYLAYNALRFGSLLENGYALIPGLLEEAQYQHGFFSIVNIPRKLYALFLSGPVEVGEFPWIQSRQLGGLSILLTTPLFLWSIKARRPDWFGLGAWASVGLILVPILLHADPGGLQFGFRYAQDLYPFLFLLTVRGLKGRISFEAWVAIAIGGLVNLWGMGSTYFEWFA